jgi:hypothetical protein
MKVPVRDRVVAALGIQGGLSNGMGDGRGTAAADAGESEGECIARLDHEGWLSQLISECRALVLE